VLRNASLEVVSRPSQLGLARLKNDEPCHQRCSKGLTHTQPLFPGLPGLTNGPRVFPRTSSSLGHQLLTNKLCTALRVVRSSAAVGDRRRRADVQADVRSSDRTIPEGHVELDGRSAFLQASAAVHRPSTRSGVSPPPAQPAVYQVHPRLAEVHVDNTVQDEVEREVDRQQHVRGDDDRIEEFHRLLAYAVVAEL